MSLPDPFDELNLGAQSVRRRDLREKSTRRSRKAARKRAVAVRKAPPTRTAAAKKPQNRRVAGKLFSAVALLLAAGFLLVNTVGFLAMPATTATASSTTADDTGQATIAGQSLTAANDGENAPIDRDTFAATSAEEYGQMQDLASVAGYTVNNSGTIRWPFNSPVPLGDPFGPRVAPCAGCSTFHNGTDFETGDLASVYATAAGTVTQAGIIGDLGEAVEIDHDVNGQKFTSVYGHMTMGSLKVSVGDKITEGELVGLTGSTGESTGPHLFFGIDINGTPIDSFKWLKEYTAH